MRSNRTKNIVLILIWAFVGSVAAYYLYSAAQNGGISFEPIYEGEPSFTLSDVTLDQSIDSVTIDWISGGVKIIPTLDKQIRIVEKAHKLIDENKEVKLTVSGSNLTLQTRNKSTFYFFGFSTRGTYLEVYLPITTSFKTIKLSGVSGNYTIDELYSDLTQINLVSGDLHVKNNTSSVFNLSMTSGDVSIVDSEFLTSTLKMTSGELDFSAQTNSLKTTMTSGDAVLHLLNALPSTLNLEMTSGDIEVTLYGSSAFNLTVDKTSGDFNTNFPTTMNGHTYSYLSGGPTYSIKMTSGNIDVKLIKD